MRRPPRRCAFVPSNPQEWLRPAGVLATAVAVSRLAVLWRGSAQLAAEQVAEARRFAEEQAALRRVATMAARRVPREELFAAVVDEVRRVLPAAVAAIERFESDGTITIVATSSLARDRLPVGSRWPLG